MTCCFTQAALDELKAEIRGAEGGGKRNAKLDVASFKVRYGVTQEVCDSAAGVPGPGAGDPAGRGVADCAVKAFSGRRAAVGFLEVLDALADAAADLGQPAGAEDQDDEEENDD